MTFLIRFFRLLITLETFEKGLQNKRKEVELLSVFSGMNV